MSRRWLILLLPLLLGACAARPYVQSLNPLHPNWEIEETALEGQRVQIVLRMKPYYAGGAGEARALFDQRAREIAEYNRYGHYQVVRYAETLDSAILGSRRGAQGIIELSR